jgi:hypothetical protein
MKPQDLTSGRLGAVVSVLFWLGEHQALSATSLETLLVNQNYVPTLQMAREGIKTAFELSLVVEEKGQIHLSSIGKRLLQNSDKENSKSLTHFVLLEILTRIRRDLLWIGSVDVQTIREADTELFEAMQDTGLFAKKLTSSAEAFWAKVRSLGSYSDASEAKIAAGRAAEELSLTYEIERLSRLGRTDLAEKVKIVSENTLLGYDVLSFSENSEGQFRLLHVEVKKISLEGENPYFFLSKNEAEQADALQDDYVFHLWPSLGEGTSPIILPGSLILEKLPVNLYPQFSEWMDCRVWISGFSSSLLGS